MNQMAEEQSEKLAEFLARAKHVVSTVNSPLYLVLWRNAVRAALETNMIQAASFIVAGP